MRPPAAAPPRRLEPVGLRQGRAGSAPRAVTSTASHQQGYVPAAELAGVAAMTKLARRLDRRCPPSAALVTAQAPSSPRTIPLKRTLPHMAPAEITQHTGSRRSSSSIAVAIGQRSHQQHHPRPERQSPRTRICQQQFRERNGRRRPHQRARPAAAAARQHRRLAQVEQLDPCCAAALSRACAWAQRFELTGLCARCRIWPALQR